MTATPGHLVGRFLFPPMKKLHQAAQQQAQQGPAAFDAWFAKLPTAHQYELQYHAVGTSVVDAGYPTAAKARAQQLGLAGLGSPGQLVAAHFGAKPCGCHGPAQVGAAGDVVAVEVALSDIHTDPARFQNRKDAFSELSADAVARHYDPNKFDPIVV